jgi:hypothetical protein
VVGVSYQFEARFFLLLWKIELQIANRPPATDLFSEELDMTLRVALKQ